MGFMGRSAKGIKDFVKVVLQKNNIMKHRPACARFAPMPWDEDRSMSDRKLKIGW
jgi:hypothetical protein